MSTGSRMMLVIELAEQGGLRFVHAANGLEQLFKAKFRHDDRGKEERDLGIPHAEGNEPLHRQ